MRLTRARITDVRSVWGPPEDIPLGGRVTVPRVAQTMVVGLARDAVGRTAVVGSSTGDATQARILGGLLDDPGLANVLDRVGAISAETRGVLIVEGGTDEAYLCLAAGRLGRAEVLGDIEVRPAG